jgi:CBS domain-containing protein
VTTTPVKDVMTSNVIWMKQDTPFPAIAAAFRQHRVGAFPVVNTAGKVIGVVSEADLLAKLALGGGDDRLPGMIHGIRRRQRVRKARATTAGDLMSVLPVTVSLEDTVEQAARLMFLHRVKHLPVVDADDRLVGMISGADVLSVFHRPDEDIRNEVLAAVVSSASLPDAIGISVRDGIVTLTGTADSGETARDITGRVRHIEGVVAVRDRLDYPPPGAGGFDALAESPAD